MKKSLLLLCLFLNFGIIAHAEDSMIVTTTIPEATYTLNIPSNQEIIYGTTSTEIGNVTVVSSSGFEVGKNLNVTIEYNPFESTTVDTIIPFYLQINSENHINDDPDNRIDSGEFITFKGKNDGTLVDGAQVKVSNGYSKCDRITLHIDHNAWGKALPGDYSSTITFTSAIVIN